MSILVAQANCLNLDFAPLIACILNISIDGFYLISTPYLAHLTQEPVFAQGECLNCTLALTKLHSRKRRGFNLFFGVEKSALVHKVDPKKTEQHS